MVGIVVKKVNARQGASTGDKILGEKQSGAALQITGLKSGESYRGSKLWYTDAQGLHYTSHAVSITNSKNKLSQLLDFSKLWTSLGNTDLKVGIYDSGVSKNEALFQDRVVQMNHTDADISDHHADYMATIIAGGDFINGYIGLLPTATIYSYRSPKRGNDQIITLADLKQALRRFIDQQVDVINISMRSTEENDAFRTDQELAGLLATCRQNMIPVVTAAGNDASRSDTFFCYPARCKAVYAVSGCRIFNQPSPSFDPSCNLWTGVSLLSVSQSIFPPEFFTNIKLAGAIGSSVATAICSGTIGALKIKASTQLPMPELFGYLSNKFSALPDWANDDQGVSAPTFKVLNLSILKNL
jgi:subtilisin family serine protease